METEIRIDYCITESLDAQSVREAMQQLSDDERMRCDRLVRERDRRDFAVAHALLRQSLSAYGSLRPEDWTFTTGPHGKPSLTADLAAREGLSFNLAHTDGLVACCVARDADVGVDVEAIVSSVDIQSVAARFFSPAEAAELEQCGESLRLVRFTELWTLKESYIKARGDGLLHALDRFTFHFEESSWLRFVDAEEAGASEWSFALFAPTRRHRMAVAVNRRTAHFSLRGSIVPVRSTKSA
jgi:4'-phosphopantetheinyl transferase